MEYNSELPELLQLERYAISRILISNLFELPGNVKIGDGIRWAKDNDLTESDIAEAYDELLPRYQAALAEVNFPFQALHLADSVAAIEEFALAANWYGYAGKEEPLTGSQQAYAEARMEQCVRLQSCPGGWGSYSYPC